MTTYYMMPLGHVEDIRPCPMPVRTLWDLIQNMIPW